MSSLNPKDSVAYKTEPEALPILDWLSTKATAEAMSMQNWLYIRARQSVEANYTAENKAYYQGAVTRNPPEDVALKVIQDALSDNFSPEVIDIVTGELVLEFLIERNWSEMSEAPEVDYRSIAASIFS